MENSLDNPFLFSASKVEKQIHISLQESETSYDFPPFKDFPNPTWLTNLLDSTQTVEKSFAWGDIDIESPNPRDIALAVRWGPDSYPHPFVSEVSASHPRVPHINALDTSDADFDNFQEISLSNTSEQHPIITYIRYKFKQDPNNMDLIKHPSSVSKPTWTFALFMLILEETGQWLESLKSTCTCQKMTAGDAEFMCAGGHGKQPQSCNAWDYGYHTLESLIRELSEKSVCPNPNDVSKATIKIIKGVSRRIYRIYAHVFLNHRTEFNAWENVHHTTKKFLVTCKTYKLLASAHAFVKELDPKLL